MPQISIINKSDVQKAHRFDAEFFKPEFLKRIKILKQNFSFLDKFITKGSYGILPKSDDYIEEGLPLIRGKDLRRNDIEKENLVKVPESYYSEKYKVSKGDLLILVKGATIAFPDGVLLIQKDIGNAIFNGSVFRIKLNKNINKYFLYVFMTSRYFTFQKEREVANNGIEYNSLNTIKKYLIPILSQHFQLEIEKIVKSAYKKQTQSKQLYKEAEGMLLKELDLIGYEPRHILNFETTKKKTDEAKRFDAGYFQPKYEEIIKKIENYQNGYDVVKNIANIKKGVEVGSETYQQDGMSFGRVSDFSINGVEGTGKKISKELYQDLKEDYQPKRDDILFTKDGTIGLSYVVKEEFEIILSGAFLRLSLKEKYQNFEKECLVLVFNSIVCKMQIEKLSGGAVIAHLKPSDFEKFRIPLIKSKIQKEIAKKIKESHKLNKESKELLEEAKRKVEQEIEKK